MELILASTSRYRKLLLQRLQLPFSCQAPGVEEATLPGETPEATAIRLALAKAEAVAALNPEALVIGSDQVACIDGVACGKPVSHQRAREQLQASAGKSVQFYTALALVCRQQGLVLQASSPFSVHFRQLSEAEIENYLQRERPYDCAGSFKCEGLGVALFRRMEGDDPTALEGLPLIALCDLLRRAGVAVLD